MLKPWEVIEYLERYMMKKYLESLEAESESDSYFPSGAKLWHVIKQTGGTVCLPDRREM